MLGKNSAVVPPTRLLAAMPLDLPKAKPLELPMAIPMVYSDTPPDLLEPDKKRRVRKPKKKLTTYNPTSEDWDAAENTQWWELLKREVKGCTPIGVEPKYEPRISPISEDEVVIEVPGFVCHIWKREALSDDKRRFLETEREQGHAARNLAKMSADASGEQQPYQPKVILEHWLLKAIVTHISICGSPRTSKLICEVKDDGRVNLSVKILTAPNCDEPVVSMQFSNLLAADARPVRGSYDLLSLRKIGRMDFGFRESPDSEPITMVLNAAEELPPPHRLRFELKPAPNKVASDVASPHGATPEAPAGARVPEIPIQGVPGEGIQSHIAFHSPVRAYASPTSPSAGGREPPLLVDGERSGAATVPRQRRVQARSESDSPEAGLHQGSQEIEILLHGSDIYVGEWGEGLSWEEIKYNVERACGAHDDSFVPVSKERDLEPAEAATRPQTTRPESTPPDLPRALRQRDRERADQGDEQDRPRPPAGEPSAELEAASDNEHEATIPGRTNTMEEKEEGDH
eukprot:Hpha_TRINITY_DN15247_c2_g1::TRINITY_DN15247_c2_g1_i1::g.64844::m.64844